MATVYDVEPNAFIEALSEKLSSFENTKQPEWASFVKTGMAKERVPSQDNWWNIRTAAIMRSIYRSKGPIGVQKLRVKYGSKKNRGHKPEKFFKASGKIIRLILQQLEAEGLLEQAEKGVHKGRVLTPKGKSLMDKTASSLVGKKAKPVKKVEKPVEAKPAEKKEEKKVEETKEEPVKEQKEEAPKEKVEEKKEEPKEEEKPAKEVKEETPKE